MGVETENPVIKRTEETWSQTISDQASIRIANPG